MNLLGGCRVLLALERFGLLGELEEKGKRLATLEDTGDGGWRGQCLG